MTKEDYRMTRSSFGSDKSPKSSPDLDDTACQDGRNAWHPARSSKETTVSRTPWQPKSPSCSRKLSRRGCGTHDSIRTVEQWNNVLWSDESSFQLFCGAKRAFVKRQKGKGLAHSALSPQLSMEGLP